MLSVTTSGLALEAIGSTLLIKLQKLPDAAMAEVWVKYEGVNPSGSMKDRMALALIEAAEQQTALVRPELYPTLA